MRGDTSRCSGFMSAFRSFRHMRTKSTHAVSRSDSDVAPPGPVLPANPVTVLPRCTADLGERHHSAPLVREAVMVVSPYQ